MKIKIRVCPLRLCRPRTNSLLSCHFKIVLNRTKQCHKERNAEIHYKSVEDGDNYKLLSGRSCNDGQCGVHRSCPSGRDRGEVAEPAHQ